MNRNSEIKMHTDEETGEQVRFKEVSLTRSVIFALEPGKDEITHCSMSCPHFHSKSGESTAYCDFGSDLSRGFMKRLAVEEFYMGPPSIAIRFEFKVHPTCPFVGGVI
jgi:hypothetical protein